MQGLQPMHSAAAASCNLFATMISSKWRAWRMATSMRARTRRRAQQGRWSQMRARYPVLGPCVLFNDHTSTVSLMLRIGTHRATMRGTRARWQLYICHPVPMVPLIPTFVPVARVICRSFTFSFCFFLFFFFCFTPPHPHTPAIRTGAVKFRERPAGSQPSLRQPCSAGRRAARHTNTTAYTLVRCLSLTTAATSASPSSITDAASAVRMPQLCPRDGLGRAWRAFPEDDDSPLPHTARRRAT